MTTWRQISGAALIGLMAFVTASRAADSEGSPKAAGDVQLTRWDVLLNSDGRDVIDQLDLTAVSTKSRNYQASLCDAAALRGAVAQAASTNGLENYGSNMQFSRAPLLEIQQSQYFNFNQTKQSRVDFFAQATGSDHATDVGDGKAHLAIADTDVDEHLYDRPRQRNDQGAEYHSSLLFDGALSPGQSLIFLGKFTTKTGIVYHHLIVWEAFRAEQWMMPMIRNVHDVAWWCQNGPEGLRNTIAASVVWSARATHTPQDVQPDFSQKLEDGKTVKLEEISNMHKWPYCWWDAQGKPVAAQSEGYLWGSEQSGDANCEISVYGDKSENAKTSPVGVNVYTSGLSQFHDSTELPVDKSGSVTVGIPVGNWTQVSDAHTGKPFYVDGVQYHLNRMMSGSDEFEIELWTNKKIAHADQMIATVVWRDGTEIAPLGFNSMRGENDNIFSESFLGDASKVKVYHIWKRKCQWVTFTKLPLQPDPLPPQTVSASELAAARPIYSKQQSDRSKEELEGYWDRMQEGRKEWEKIAPNPKTARGALWAILIAAEKGDAAGIRARLTGRLDDEKTLDVMAREQALFSPLEAAALQRYGPSAIADFYSLGYDYDMVNFADDWQDRPDGGLQCYFMVVVKGAGDQYYLDLSKDLPNGVDLLNQYTNQDIPAEQAAAAAMKNNPNLSEEDFRQILQTRPIAAPTAAP